MILKKEEDVIVNSDINDVQLFITQRSRHLPSRPADYEFLLDSSPSDENISFPLN